jgi:transposase-like protein
MRAIKEQQMSSKSEVHSKGKRRIFTAAEKARILAEYENAPTPVERAVVMRREGVYSSHIANWRKARDSGEEPAKARGRRANPDAAELVRLRKDNQRLQRRLEKADQTIEVLGKVHALLQMAAGESASDEQSSRKS